MLLALATVLILFRLFCTLPSRKRPAKPERTKSLAVFLGSGNTNCFSLRTSLKLLTIRWPHNRGPDSNFGPGLYSLLSPNIRYQSRRRAECAEGLCVGIVKGNNRSESASAPLFPSSAQHTVPASIYNIGHSSRAPRPPTSCDHTTDRTVFSLVVYLPRHA
jgi:hypothetical protein